MATEQSLPSEARAAPKDIHFSSKAVDMSNTSPSKSNLQKSTISSTDGSPPIPTGPLPPGRKSKKNQRSYTSHPSSPHNTPLSSDRPRPNSRINPRMASGSGNLQVAQGETSSWSDLAQQDPTLPSEAKEKPNAVLGFLSRKRGRGHSPKPQERGILGKEGARVVINQ